MLRELCFSPLQWDDGDIKSTFHQWNTGAGGLSGEVGLDKWVNGCEMCSPTRLYEGQASLAFVLTWCPWVWAPNIVIAFERWRIRNEALLCEMGRASFRIRILSVEFVDGSMRMQELDSAEVVDGQDNTLHSLYMHLCSWTRVWVWHWESATLKCMFSKIEWSWFSSWICRR